jgi:pectate lyase
MKLNSIILSLLVPATLALGACSSGGGANGNGTGGNAPGSGGATAGGATSSGGVGSGGVTGSGGSGSGGVTASGGASGSGGASSGGATGSGGARTGGATGGGGTSAAGGTTSSGGTTATGGKTTGSGGSANGGTTTAAGGTSTATGGARTGGSTGTGGTTAPGGATGTGGSGSGGSSGTSISVSPTCKVQTWPTATGSPVNISGTKKVTDYDGKGALHDGDLNDCTVGDQDSTDAMFEVADGGSVKNVIFGKKIGDGIHCLGSCTIENVWFPYVCDDAITINIDGASSGTSSIKNSGFKGARDKTIQHNGGNSTLNIDNVYVEVAGKLYRSCGSGGGCTTSAKHTVNISNVVAVGVNQVAGVSENDMVTLSNICVFRTPTLCNTYKVNSDTDSTKASNGTGEGPGPNCSYKASDVHALVDRVAGATLTTDVMCPGPNSSKSGSTATACITGFETCLKTCAPGMYGFKQLTCSGGNYSSPETGGCALVTSAADSAAATNLAGTRAATASGTVTKNNSCTTQWALGIDSSKSTNTCACVEKPGYYQQSSGYAQPVSWMVWDCQSQWW